MGNTFTLYSQSVLYKLINVFLTFINSILLNRCLGVALRGEYTTIITVASLLQLILNFGLGSAYPSFKGKYPFIAKQTLFTAAIILLSIYIGIFIIVLCYGDFDSIYITAIAIASVGESILVSFAVVEDVKKRNFINIWVTFINTILFLFIFIFYKQNLIYILLAVISNHVILCFVVVKIFNFRICPLHEIKSEYLKFILKIGLPAMMMNILIYLNYHADILFLSYLQSNPVVVGLYGTAVTLGNMLWIIPDAFKDIILYRVSKKEEAAEIIQSIAVNFIICIIIIIGFVIIGKWFIVSMYGKDFAPSYPITLIIFLGTFPMVLYKLIHPVYIVRGQMKPVVALLSISVIINAVLDYIFIPTYGGYGAAWASVISYSVCGIAFLIKFKVDTGVKIMLCLKNLFIQVSHILRH